MENSKQRFIEAQRWMLDRHGVTASSRFVSLASRDDHAHVLTCGDGPDVVLLNGVGLPGAMWAPLMATLAGFRLHAVDLPGFGLTDATNFDARDQRRSAVRFLGEVLDALELDRVSIVANSLGSLWASWFAIERPERVSALVHAGCPALVLGASAPLPLRLLSARPLGRLLTRLQPPSPAQVEKFSRMAGEHPLEPELVDLLVATESLPDYRQTFLTTLNSVLRLRGSRPRFRMTAEQLQTIEQPTLIFWGEDDPFGSPDVGVRMVQLMPRAQMRVIGGGHAPWLTQAAVMGPAIMTFLHRNG